MMEAESAEHHSLGLNRVAVLIYSQMAAGYPQQEVTVYRPQVALARKGASCHH